MKHAAALVKFTGVANSPPHSWETVELVTCNNTHDIQTKPIIPQVIAEVTNQEREFLLGYEVRGRLKMRHSSTLVIQGPSATSDTAEVRGQGKLDTEVLYDLPVKLMPDTTGRALIASVGCYYFDFTVQEVDS